MEMSENKTRPRFKNPPIVEAVIAISIPPISKAEVFQAVSPAMDAAGYSTSEPVKQYQFQMKIVEGESTATTADSLLGIKYNSADREYVVQFLANSFIFSKIGRYDTWEAFRGEARRIWEIYATTAGTDSTLGVGVRYINKVFVPFGENPRDYIRSGIELPDSVGGSVAEMLMRVGLPITDPPGKFIHTQALLPEERSGFAAILLDNDFQFPTLGKPIKEVWELLEKVRDLKDHYFLELTTQKLQESFNA